MPTLDWTCEQTDGVTLVELQIHGESGQRVRVESSLDPVWPPRHEGQPAAGWDGAAFEDTIEDGSLVVGYASPAEPTDPPAELVAATGDEEIIDPGDVVRALGTGTPPRDAVPKEPTSTAEDDPVDTGEASPEVHPDQSPPTAADTGREPALPPAVESYFAAIEQRLAAAEAVSEAETVEQAREAVAATGGMGAVERLTDQLAADRTRLDAFERRQRELSDRLAETTIPVAHLERLA